MFLLVLKLHFQIQLRVYLCYLSGFLMEFLPDADSLPHIIREDETADNGERDNDKFLVRIGGPEISIPNSRESTSREIESVDIVLEGGFSLARHPVLLRTEPKRSEEEAAAKMQDQQVVEEGLEQAGAGADCQPGGKGHECQHPGEGHKHAGSGACALGQEGH